MEHNFGIYCIRNIVTGFGIKYSEQAKKNVSQSRRTPHEFDRQSKVSKERWSKPEEKRKLSERNLENWRDPEYREKMSAVCRQNAQKAAIASGKKSAKTYPGFIDPHGKEYTNIINLPSFAKEHGLNYYSLYKLARGITNSLFGWTRI